MTNRTHVNKGPVKRGNWGYGYQIENTYKDDTHDSCYTCKHCNDNKVCSYTGVPIPSLGKNTFRYCSHFSSILISPEKMKQLMSPETSNTKKEIKINVCENKQVNDKKNEEQQVIYDNTRNRIKDIASIISTKQIESICFHCIKSRLIFDVVLTNLIFLYTTDKKITSNLKKYPNKNTKTLRKKFFMLLANKYNWDIPDIYSLSKVKRNEILHNFIKDKSVIIKRGLGNSVKFYLRKNKAEKYLNLSAILYDTDKFELYFEVPFPSSSIYEGFNFKIQNLLYQGINTELVKAIKHKCT